MVTQARVYGWIRLPSPLARLASVAALLASCAPLGPPPNVIVIVLDTVRADGVSLSGEPVDLTPNIARLAREGVSFSRAYAPSTWTRPSIATLFTARYAEEHRIRSVVEQDGVRMVVDRLRLALYTMAERFQDGGYTTAAFGTQVQLQENLGFGQGFDLYSWGRGDNAHLVNARLVEWLESAPERPVFVYLHYMDPHWPYDEREPELAAAIGVVKISPEPPFFGNEVDEWLAAGPAPGWVQGLRSRYDHGVATVDKGVGNALRALEQHGVLEDAVVVVTSDHGEGFMEHGRLLHGYAPYEEVARIPLILRAPERFGFRPGAIEHPVGLIDVLPTLLDLAGLEPLVDGDQGRSLVPLLSGETLESRWLYVETGGFHCLTDGAHKLMRLPDGRMELYDLLSDPTERHPLPCEGECLKLAEELEERATRAAMAASPSGDEAVEVDEADVERLRALGYLD